MLYDSQHSCDLPGVNHLSSITGEERLEELHETGDAALLLPACGREEEWEEGTIFGWHAGDMCFQHLSENLENVRDILCKTMSILGDKIVYICSSLRSMSCWRINVKGPKRACSNAGRVDGVPLTTNL